MPSGRIPDYPSATLPISGVELLEIVQANQTRKCAVGDIFVDQADLTLRAQLASIVSAALGTSMVGYLNEGAGAQGRALNEKLDEFTSLTDFNGGVIDGSIDSTAALEAALAQNPRVYIPEGTFKFKNMDCIDGARVYGAGYNTIIQVATGAAPEHVFRCNSVDNVEIAYMRFEVDKTLHPTTVCIWGFDSNNIHVHDITFAGAGLIGVFMADVTEVVVEHCTVRDAAASGITLATVTLGNYRCKILDNLVSIPGSSASGISISAGSRCLIRGNSVNTSGIFGIQFAACTYSRMTQNTTFNTNREGCNMSDSIGCSIDTNVVVWDGVSGIDFGISIAAPNEPNNYNTVMNNIVVNSPKSGIALAANGVAINLLGNTVANNVVVNPNCVSDGLEGSGILLNGGSDARQNFIHGNHLYGASNMYFGVYDSDTSIGTIVRNNVIKAAITEDIRLNASDPTRCVALNGTERKNYYPVPTVIGGTQAIVTYTINFADYREDEWHVDVVLDITFNDISGAGGTELRIPLPFTAASGEWVWAGREAVTGGKMLQGIVNAGGSNIRIFDYSNAFPIADGSRVRISGRYERARA